MQTVNTKNYTFWPWIVYPGTMALCLCLFAVLNMQELSLILCSYVPVMLGAVIITLLEFRTPHVDGWRATSEDLRNDLTFMVVVQMLLPMFLNFLAAVAVLRLLHAGGFRPDSLWPHHWHVVLQALAMLLAADFMRYWLHRLAHESPFLWKFHAVHHSPHKLYWVNVGRFHPVDKTLQFLCDALPFIIVGISEDVLALYFVFYAVNGFFQHSNVEMRLGLLNFLISSAELHRWHHSREPTEANRNYGNNIIVWDLLFSTYFLPRDRHVGALGLRNTSYPQDFSSQMKTPFSLEIDQRPALLSDYRSLVLNALLWLRMKSIRRRLYLPLQHAAMKVKDTQWLVLQSILQRNKDTEFGIKHRFSEISDVESFRARVPVFDYEDLRADIERQGRDHTAVLTSEHPVMYNQTSGTTGEPKYIPVLARTLDQLAHSQKIFSYVQYRSCRAGFSGRMVGLVSPAIDGYLPSGIPYGSASGHIYRTMPSAAKAKYLLPEEVFSLDDYELKYQVIGRLCFEADDITYLGSANPSTFHRLLDVINEHRDGMVDDIEKGIFRRIDDLAPVVAAAVRKCLHPNPFRAHVLHDLLASGQPSTYADFWPHLSIIATWTGGSCGVSLAGILPSFPPQARVTELGYLASEVRGSITVDADTNEGLPTIHENFFEFVEQDAWEQERGPFVGAADLRPLTRYNVFVTTPAGLYRYDMNDIVEVTGHFGACPTIRFVQKGRGVTNITGEKLYESQIIEAMNCALSHFEFSCRFYQVLADEHQSNYVLFLEPKSGTNVDTRALATYIDDQLCSTNLEYEAKRLGKRLLPLKLLMLQSGSYERYKQHCLAKGQRESQFKGMLLQYARDHDFDWYAWVASE